MIPGIWCWTGCVCVPIEGLCILEISVVHTSIIQATKQVSGEIELRKNIYSENVMQINQIRIQNNDFRVPRATLDTNYQLKLCNKIARR